MARWTPALAVLLLLTRTAWSSAANGPPFTFAVKHDRLFGASRGRLVFDRDAVQYKTTERKAARTWRYERLKQVQVRSSRRIHIRTYEDQGWWKLGADRTFEFELTEGTIGPDFVAFLLARIDRPVVTAVMPPLPDEPPLARVPVKHQRRIQGSEGTLVLYGDRLVYLTEREGEARHWRWEDLFSVLRLDRDRLELRAYEGGGGKTRSFVFELQAALPPGAYETLWEQVNRAVTSSRAAEPARTPRHRGYRFARQTRRPNEARTPMRHGAYGGGPQRGRTLGSVSKVSDAQKDSQSTASGPVSPSRRTMCTLRMSHGPGDSR